MVLIMLCISLKRERAKKKTCHPVVIIQLIIAMLSISVLVIKWLHLSELELIIQS